MTKFILLALLASSASLAQSTDELTLESTTAPTVIEDNTDLSAPVDAPDTDEVTENYLENNVPVPPQLPDTSPMELTNKSAEDSPDVKPVEEDAVDTAEVSPEDIATPNPIADESQPLEDKPESEKIVDQVPSPSVSTPVIATRAPEDDRFINHRKSHWITTFGFEGMKYELPWNFEGDKRNVREREQELYGGRFGVGGQLYLGGGFFTTSMVEAFYVGTLTRTIQVAGPDVVDEEAARIKRTGGLWGGEIAQQLGFLFEFRTKNPFMDEWAYLTFEPFVEAGVGIAHAYHSVDYRYNTEGTANPGGINEFYKVRLRDELTNARIGVGFNMTSRSGFFLQAKATVNRYDITDRKIDSTRKQDDQNIQRDAKVRESDVKIDPITVVFIGGGYKF